MIHMSEGTRSKFLLSFDQYGDSLTDDVDAEKLKRIFQGIKDPGDLITMDGIQKVEMDYFNGGGCGGGGGGGRFSLFRGCRLYACTTTTTPTNDLILGEFCLHGGCVVGDMVEGDTTHVLVGGDETGEGQEDTIREVVALWDEKPVIVGVEWIRDCLREGRIVPSNL